MNKVAGRVGLVLVLAGMVPIGACFSSSNNSPPANNSSGSNDTGSGSTDTGGSGSTDTSGSTQSSGSNTSSSAMVQALPSTTTFGPTIDDMTNAQTETGGAWYTYSDRTVPNSEPPITPTPAPAGTVKPSEGDSFPPVNPGDGNSIPALSYAGGPVAARECVASGEKSWGAGFGMDLQSVTPDGSAVALNSCDAGFIFVNDGGPQNVGIPQPYDASAYTGFAFWGIALGSANVTVEVHLDDDQTTPWGGECSVCQNGGKCAGTTDGGSTVGCPCSDNFVEKVILKPGIWKQYAIRWKDSSFKAGAWSGEGSLPFHANKVYNIHFQFTTSSGAALPATDVAVAYLQWLTN